MNATKLKRLRAAGWKVGSAKDFLKLSDEEVALVELKLSLAGALKQARQKRRLSQVDLAQRMGSSQSRVAKIEAGDPSVTIDLMVRAILATGATRRAQWPISSAPPPSTSSETPVMKLASSEARNSAAFATSHAVPILRRSGTRASRIAATSARLLPVWRARVSTAIGVSINPGRITLARTPYSAFWIATCSVKAIIAALVAL